MLRTPPSAKQRPAQRDAPEPDAQLQAVNRVEQPAAPQAAQTEAPPPAPKKQKAPKQPVQQLLLDLPPPPPSRTSSPNSSPCHGFPSDDDAPTLIPSSKPASPARASAMAKKLQDLKTEQNALLVHLQTARANLDKVLQDNNAVERHVESKKQRLQTLLDDYVLTVSSIAIESKLPLTDQFIDGMLHPLQEELSQIIDQAEDKLYDLRNRVQVDVNLVKQLTWDATRISDDIKLKLEMAEDLMDNGHYSAVDATFAADTATECKTMATVDLTKAFQLIIKAVADADKEQWNDDLKQATKGFMKRALVIDAAARRALPQQRQPPPGSQPSAPAAQAAPPGGAAAAAASNIQKMKPPTFSGDHRHYASFKQDFQDIIVPGRSEKQQVYTMKHECLPKSAKDLVTNLKTMGEVWSALESKYGGANEIIHSVTEGIKGLEMNYKDPHNSLIALVDAIERGLADLRTVNEEAELQTCSVVNRIAAKLPYKYKEDWVEKEPSIPGNTYFDRFWHFMKTRRETARKLLLLDERTYADSVKPVDRKDKEKDKEKQSRGSQDKRQAKVNTVRASAAPTGAAGGHGGAAFDGGEGCIIHPEAAHLTRKCRQFKAMSLAEREQAVANAKGCVFCLARGHDFNKPCPRKGTWDPCGIDSCTEYHSRFLHKPAGSAVPTAPINTAAASCTPALMLVQNIQVQNSALVTMWDSGASMSIISSRAVKKLGLQGSPVSCDVVTVGGGKVSLETYLHKVALSDRHGGSHVIQALEMGHITDEAKPRNYESIVKLFPKLDGNLLQRPAGGVDLLVGIGYQELHPVRLESKENVGLYGSKFGTGWMLAGFHDLLGTDKQADAALVWIRHARVSGVKPNVDIDFFSSESFGVNVKPKCKRCKTCKECCFETEALSRKESKELQLIKDNMQLSSEGYWQVKYPFIDDPFRLKDNYAQALALLTRLEKRLMRDSSLAEAYTGEMNKFIERGVLKKIEPAELEAWQGPVNYVSHHEVYKLDSVTTPVRIVSNSSLEYQGLSLNALLAKGPNILTNLVGLLLRFRSWRYALVYDLTKAYQSMLTGPTERHVRRMLWRDLDVGKKPDVYGMETVTFGDRPAAAQLEVAKRGTAEAFSFINPAAAEKIKIDSYVDDGATGADCPVELASLKQDIPEILKRGGFKVKHVVCSGDEPVEGAGQVLGLKWTSDLDELAVNVKINTSTKVKGKHKTVDLTLDNLDDKLKETPLTRRVLLGIVNTCYDPLGLISPITVTLKIKMRDLHSKELNLTWDTPLPETAKPGWIKAFKELKLAENLSFQRSVRPKTGSSRRAALVIFWDGSDDAICAVAYVVWLGEDLMENEACLLCSKTRVNPLNRISTPRAEMNAATLSVRLRRTIVRECGLQFEFIMHIGDSECVLALLRRDSTSLKEFMGNRVAECLEGSEEKEWFHIAGVSNVADLGTRGKAKVSDLERDSEWQRGPKFLRQPRAAWPVTQDFCKSVPAAELRADASINVVSVLDRGLGRLLQKPYDVMLRVTARILQFAQNKSFKAKFIDRELYKRAEDFWIKREMDDVIKDMQNNKLTSLRPVVVDGVVYAVGRAPPGGPATAAADKIPILPYKSELAVSFMRHVHGKLHCGPTKTLMLSKQKYWVIRGRKLAAKICSECTTCRLNNKTLENQQMAPMYEHRYMEAPPFDTTALDLAGPYFVKDAVKKRTQLKVWIVVFTCVATRAVHLELTFGYDEDSVLLAMEKFTAVRGDPKLVISDQGSQLKAAAGDLAGEVYTWDWSRVNQRSALNWKFVPKEGQHQNGLAESMVKVMKQSMAKVLANTSFNYAEFETAVKSIANTINSRPLGVDSRAGDDRLRPVTPNDLLLGKTKTVEPAKDREVDGFASRLTRRYEYVQRVLSDWWAHWYEAVFPSLVPSYKWHASRRNVAVGDVCLMRYAGVRRGKYRLARVVDVRVSHDGLVRAAKLRYTTGAGNKPKFIERPIQSLVVIVPIEEQQV